MRGQFSEALQHYRKAPAIQPRDPLAAQKNLAWLLATCPVASQRNGEEAVELAERANRARWNGRRPRWIRWRPPMRNSAGFPRLYLRKVKPGTGREQHAHP